LRFRKKFKRKAIKCISERKGKKTGASICPKEMIKQSIPSVIPAENTWVSEAVSTDAKGL
jgi:hypothetical protein